MKTLTVEPKMICGQCGCEYSLDNHNDLFNNQCGCGGHEDFFRKWELSEDDGVKFTDESNIGEISEELLGTLNVHDNIILEGLEITLLNENGEEYLKITDGEVSDKNVVIELK